MEVLISGQAGRAILVNGQTARLIAVKEPAAVRSVPPASIHLYFQGCTDVQTRNDVNELEACLLLTNAYLADRRARLERISNDEAEPKQIRDEAVAALGSLGAQEALTTAGSADAAQQASQQMRDAMRQSGPAVAQTTRAGAQLGAEISRPGGYTLAEGRRQIMDEVAERFERMGQHLAQAMQGSSASQHEPAVPPSATAEAPETSMAADATTSARQPTPAPWIDPAAVFDLQRRFVSDYLDSVMQVANAFLHASRQTAEQFLSPIDHIGRSQQGPGLERHEHSVVADVMRPGVRLVNPDDTVQQATRVMREEDTGVLLVGEGDRLVGIVTDRDVTLRLVAEGKDPARTKVREVMTQDVKYVFEDEDLDQVAGNMAEQQVRRLPVVNRNKRLVGVVSIGDLAGDRHGIRRAGRAMHGVARGTKDVDVA